MASVQLVRNGGWDERVLVCRHETLVDTFIVVAERVVVLVDTMFNPATALALLEIAREHAGDRPLLALNTHADWDHAWGNEAVARAGVPVVATRRCAARLSSAEMAEELRAKQERDPGTFREVRLEAPALAFDGRLTIDGGDLTLDVFPTPGHTADHVAVHIPEAGVLLAGDAAESPLPFAESPATVPALRTSLASMAALEPRSVLCCHAIEAAEGAVLRKNIAYFDALERRCREVLARPEAAVRDSEELASGIRPPAEEATLTAAEIAALETEYARAHETAVLGTLEYLRGEATRGDSEDGG